MIKLINGDCIEEMSKLEDNSIDLCLTDPPYGTTNCKWDSIIPFEPMWEQLKRVVKDNGAICLFGSEPFASNLRLSNLKMYKYDWIWLKNRGQNFASAKKQFMRAHEIVSIYYRKQPNYFPVMTLAPKGNIRKPQYHTAHKSEVYGINKMPSPNYDPTKRYPLSYKIFPPGRARDKKHPTQKPVSLLEYLIKTYTLENETVLDFTMGSGSTGVACKNLNRKFIGIEKELKYYEIARNRIYD